jgi:hypothetical protein
MQFAGRLTPSTKTVIRLLLIIILSTIYDLIYNFLAFRLLRFRFVSLPCSRVNANSYSTLVKRLCFLFYILFCQCLPIIGIFLLLSTSSSSSSSSSYYYYYYYYSYTALGLGRFFSFLILYTVRRTPWTGDQAVARPLPTHIEQHKHRIEAQTSMPWVGFEPTIPAFEQAKTVHALDREATVIGL